MKRTLNRIGPYLLWVLVLIVCLVPALFMSNPAGYLPILTFLFLSLICRLYLAGLKKSLQWEEGEKIALCRRGGRQDFGLAVHNRGFLVFPSLKVQLCLTDLFGGVDSVMDAEMTLRPRERRSLEMDVRFTHVGDYLVSVKKMNIGGLLGVLSKDGGSGAKHRVQVLPNIWKIKRLPLSHQVNNENPKARQTSQEDGMDYIGVREYEQGDAIRSIHWKLSAHSGGYMTKQMVTIGTTGLSIIVDLYSSREDAETRMELYDGLIEGVCALCNYSISNHLEHDLFYYDRDGMRKSRSFQKREELDLILQDMPKIVADKKDYPVEQLLHRACVDLYGKNNVAFVTSEPVPETIQMITRIYLRGRYPIVFLVMPEGLSENEEALYTSPLRQLDAYRIPWFAYSDPKTLEGGDFG